MSGLEASAALAVPGALVFMFLGIGALVRIEDEYAVTRAHKVGMLVGVGLMLPLLCRLLLAAVLS